MTPLVLFAILVLAPVAVAVLFRVNAAVLFMSLCVGAVLVQYVAGDTNAFIATVGGRSHSISESTIRLALLLAPPLLTAVFMFHSIHGHLRRLLNILPAIGTGLLTALLIRPLLSPAFQRTLESSVYWHQLVRAQTLVVITGAIFSLVFLWIQRHGNKERGSRYHSKSTV